MVVPLLVIQPRRIGSEQIRRRLLAKGTAVGAEGIVQAVRLEGASGSVGIGRAGSNKSIVMPDPQYPAPFTGPTVRFQGRFS